jgi:hypothetical protein
MTDPAIGMPVPADKRGYRLRLAGTDALPMRWNQLGRYRAGAQPVVAPADPTRRVWTDLNVIGAAISVHGIASPA